VRNNKGIVVDIHNAALWVDGLGYLVGVAWGGQARADVEELADTALAGQVADGTGQERPVGPRAGHYLRTLAHHFLGSLAVGWVVVLTAEPHAVDAGRMRYEWVKKGIGGAIFGIDSIHEPER
jgi:hypothetical protein